MFLIYIIFLPRAMTPLENKQKFYFFSMSSLWQRPLFVYLILFSHLPYLKNFILGTFPHPTKG